MPRAGGQLPTQMLAPASANALAIANPKPPSSETPAINARLPVRSIASMGILGEAVLFLAQDLERSPANDVEAVGQSHCHGECHDARAQRAHPCDWDREATLEDEARKRPGGERGKHQRHRGGQETEREVFGQRSEER